MAIPGLKATLDVRAKVRIGEKKTTAKGKSFPSATDYFLADDAEFKALCGERPKSIRIRFPHAGADNFTTGMEWWRGKQLTCYSKGEGSPVQAYRVIAMLDAGDIKTGQPMGRGNERQPIVCSFRDCSHFGKNADNKECRVMGRLVFFLDGGRTDSVLEFDTKAWNSIEQLEGSLSGAMQSGDLRGRVFNLTVEMVQKGRDRYPVVNLTEADIVVNTPQDVSKADALIAADKRKQAGDAPNAILAELLDVTNPGWREKPEFIARIKEVTPEVALDKMIEAV
jgi:hypothetical protein